MKKSLQFNTIGLLLFFCCLHGQATAQYDSPVSYLTFFNDFLIQTSQRSFDYASAVAHGKGARKQEKRRLEVIASLQESRSAIAKLKGYEGDLSLREGFLKYLTLSEAVFTEDYGKVVDLEEIAEQSYDNMEAYLLAKERAVETLDKEGKVADELYKSFAAKHNIHLIEDKSELSKKTEKTNRVNKYYNQIFLIFFKVSKQESYLVEALNQSDLNAIEQNRNTLSVYAKEGLEKLKAVQPFAMDASLVAACRTALSFYQDVADVKMQPLIDFFVKKSEFEKVEKRFNALGQNQRTKEEVDSFNRLVNEINSASATFNKVNREMNLKRTQINNVWNNSVTKFIDTHTPR